jgi:hypothetical protein
MMDATLMSRWQVLSGQILLKWSKLTDIESHVLATFRDRDASLRALEQSHAEFIPTEQTERIYVILGELDTWDDVAPTSTAPLLKLISRLADMIEEIHGHLSMKQTTSMERKGSHSLLVLRSYPRLNTSHLFHGHDT